MVGLFNIKKPIGMTSRRVVDIVSRLAPTRRAGHAGTLDPLASGVLVVCVGWATRLVPYVQERAKTYRAKFLLGRRSDTDDVTGNVVEVAAAPRLERAQIAAALPQFIGKFEQVPPQFSAVHVAGRRAHELARRGAVLTIEPRTVSVHRLEIVDYHYPELDLLIECGSGTYVRAIGRDLGLALGSGAVMAALVRERIGDFSLASAINLDRLVPASIGNHLLPPLAAVSHFRRHVCSAAECAEITRGRPIAWPPSLSSATGEFITLLTPAGALLALARLDADQQLLRPQQVFAADA